MVKKKIINFPKLSQIIVTCKILRELRAILLPVRLTHYQTQFILPRLIWAQCPQTQRVCFDDSSNFCWLNSQAGRQQYCMTATKESNLIQKMMRE